LKACGRKLLVTILALVTGALVVGCGGGSAPQQGGGNLTIGDIGWDESVAISNLTKALLEDELDYQKIDLKRLDVVPLFQGVSSGELDAFQDVWLPNHQEYIDRVEEDVELLEPWFLGTTRFGIAAPDYMNVTSIDQLNGTGAGEILGIEAGAVVMEKIPQNVIPTYSLKQELVEASTPSMLAEVEKRYDSEEEFVFIAWSPHWMNQRYDFVYLEDPQDALEELNDTATISTVVNKDLRDEDPVAYALIGAIRLDEEQLNELEDVINVAGDPLVGAREWMGDNRDIVQPWVDAAEAAQEA
jgi:glycine betaine/proline transport system substrate-binding protein